MTVTSPIDDASPSQQEDAKEEPVRDDHLPDAGEPQSFRQGMIFNVVIPLALLLAGFLSLMLFGSAENEKLPSADLTRTGRLKALPPVRIARLQSLESTGRKLQLEVDGSVVPYREARVAAEISGRVVFKAVECEAGSYVKQDQLLMRIDATDYELEVQRLTKLKEQEYEALSEVDQEMANAQRLIDVAKQDVALQQKELNRQRSLPSGFASRAEIDQAERALLAATQQLVSTENQLALLRKRRVRLEASERLAATQLRAAEVNLQRTEIRAPIDGVIVSEDADMNTFVPRGNTLVTIEDTSKVEVATNLRMDQLYWVLDQEGGNASASDRAYDLPETPAVIEYEMTGRDDLVYRWRGRLLSYDGIGLDPVSRTVPVRVVVDNPREYIDANGEVIEVSRTTALVRGMYVRVKLQIKPKTNLVVIPARALQPGNRVLQFVPDESVLQPKAPAAAGEGANQASREEPASGTNDGMVSFDPNEWEPGRVVVRESVNPVDSLQVSASELANQATSKSMFATGNRMWVCEARDASLQGGSFVVVSPMGTMEDGQLPVRAQRETSGTMTASERPRVKKSTARTEPQLAGDAS